MEHCVMPSHLGDHLDLYFASSLKDIAEHFSQVLGLDEIAFTFVTIIHEYPFDNCECLCHEIHLYDVFGFVYLR